MCVEGEGGEEREKGELELKEKFTRYSFSYRCCCCPPLPPPSSSFGDIHYKKNAIFSELF